MKPQIATLLLTAYLSSSGSLCYAIPTDVEVNACRQSLKAAQEDAYQVFSNAMFKKRDMKLVDDAGNLLGTCSTNKERVLHLQTFAILWRATKDEQSRTMIRAIYVVQAGVISKAIQDDLDVLTKHIIPNAKTPALANAAVKLRDCLWNLQKAWSQ